MLTNRFGDVRPQRDYGQATWSTLGDRAAAVDAANTNSDRHNAVMQLPVVPPLPPPSKQSYFIEWPG